MKKELKVFKECKKCSAKSGSPTLCGKCLVRRDGKCKHGAITGRCLKCYIKQR